MHMLYTQGNRFLITYILKGLFLKDRSDCFSFLFINQTEIQLVKNQPENDKFNLIAVD